MYIIFPYSLIHSANPVTWKVTGGESQSCHGLCIGNVCVHWKYSVLRLSSTESILRGVQKLVCAIPLYPFRQPRKSQGHISFHFSRYIEEFADILSMYIHKLFIIVYYIYILLCTEYTGEENREMSPKSSQSPLANLVS
jgi:hypothetical protein